MIENKEKKQEIFPNGWQKGDICVMITNKAKQKTCEYVVESYDGKYFGVRSHTGLFHRASPQRLFRTHEEAVESLLTKQELQSAEQAENISEEGQHMNSMTLQ